MKTKREVLVAPWPRRIIVVPLVLLGVVLFRSFLPWVKSALPGCLFFETTGWHCPGCGGTRAAEALAHLQFFEAVRQNVFLTLIPIVGILFLILLRVRERFPTSRWLGVFRWRQWMAWAFLAGMVAFAILRNLPGFEFLAPVLR